MESIESIVKNLKIIALIALFVGMPLSLMAQSEREDIETEMQSITLSVNGTQVHVSNADGVVLEVYNLTGVKIATIRIDSNDKQVNLSKLQKGYYILKVGKIVRKISIR